MSDDDGTDQIRELKARFATQRIPEAADYLALVLMAYGVRQRLGLEPETGAAGPGTGLLLDPNTGVLSVCEGAGIQKPTGELEVSAEAPLRVTSAGLHVETAPMQSLRASDSGLEIAVVAPIVTTKEGVAVATGGGLQFTDGRLDLAFDPNGPLAVVNGELRIKPSLIDQIFRFSLPKAIEALTVEQRDALYALLKSS